MNCWYYGLRNISGRAHIKYLKASPIIVSNYSQKTSSSTSKSLLRRSLLPVIYLSGISGLVLFVLIGRKQWLNYKLRKQGFITISDASFGRRSLKLMYKGTFLYDVVAKNVQAKQVENFIVKPDDVWVVSFPRSGTTWLQEIIYLIVTDLDFDAARQQILDERFPFFEFEYPGINAISGYDSPRLIKSHLPWDLLPKNFTSVKPKVVYIARNPRDVAVSYFHYARLLLPLNYNGDFKKFCGLFLKNMVPYAPWSDHVLQFWNHRNDENVLFITYEELHKNTKETIKCLGHFFGKSLSDSDINRIEEFCQLESMRSNSSVNRDWMRTLGQFRPNEEPFIRKGKIGGWIEYFDKVSNTRMEMMVRQLAKDGGPYFDYYP